MLTGFRLVDNATYPRVGLLVLPLVIASDKVQFAVQSFSWTPIMAKEMTFTVILLSLHFEKTTAMRLESQLPHQLSFNYSIFHYPTKSFIAGNNLFIGLSSFELQSDSWSFSVLIPNSNEIVISSRKDPTSFAIFTYLAFFEECP